MNADAQSRITAISKWIDGSYPPDLDPEAHMRRRVSKVNEEAGEVHEALGAFWGENPRKPRVVGIAPVIKELLDTAAAALGAVEHLTGNQGAAFELLDEHIGRVAERARRVERHHNPRCFQSVHTPEAMVSQGLPPELCDCKTLAFLGFDGGGDS